MKRRNFLQLTVIGTGAFAFEQAYGFSFSPNEIAADLVIAGAGLGGCAAALSALNNGLKVVLTEDSDWIGGQLTSQGVPPDEHQWIETHGSSKNYRRLRTNIRNYYKHHEPLTADAMARPKLNPGDGLVS